MTLQERFPVSVPVTLPSAVTHTWPKRERFKLANFPNLELFEIGTLLPSCIIARLSDDNSFLPIRIADFNPTTLTEKTVLTERQTDDNVEKEEDPLWCE